MLCNMPCLLINRPAQELEEGIATLSADLKRARKDLEASRADNLALVERLKYVQGYQAAAGKSRKGAHICRTPHLRHWRLLAILGYC